MDNPTYASRLRYLDADDVDDAVVDYDGLDVLGHDGEKIGDVEGFIVDPDASRAYYIVVDSGGWFRSRRFLLPIGHARLDADRRALRADVATAALTKYPEFDADDFRKFTDDELRAFERRTLEACCPDEPLADVPAGRWEYETRRHYTQPEWWRPASFAGERLRPVDSTAYRSAAPATRQAHQREHMTARGDEPDYSPHLDGRAQPGDVLGIETGGERTYVGDTAEDENKRRRTAERSAVEEERPPRSER
jgi:hypothetical protein